jgi:hypothetical protein
MSAFPNSLSTAAASTPSTPSLSPRLRREPLQIPARSRSANRSSQTDAKTDRWPNNNGNSPTQRKNVEWATCHRPCPDNLFLQRLSLSIIGCKYQTENYKGDNHETWFHLGSLLGWKSHDEDSNKFSYVDGTVSKTCLFVLDDYLAALCRPDVLQSVRWDRRH